MVRKIFSFARPYTGTLALISLLILVMAGLRQVNPLIFKRITDIVVEGNLAEDWRGVLFLLFVLLAAQIVAVVLNRASWVLANIFTIKFRGRLRQIGFEHLMRLSISYFSEQASGKLMSQLDRGVNRITMAINNSGMHFLPNLVTALIGLVIVTFYSWPVALAVLFSFIPFVWISWWRFKKNRKLELREYRLYDRQYAHFWEVIGSMPLTKSFAAENFEIGKLRKFNQKIINLWKQMERNRNMALSGDLFLDGWNWLLYAYIVYLALTGAITVGTMVLLVTYLRLLREPLWAVNWVFWEFKRAQVGAKDFLRILAVKQEILDPKKPVKLDQVKGEIKFEKVSFTYKMGDFVLDNVSLTIKPGETVALVGPSGAGKSTIAGLIVRFFDPDKGRLLLDGVDLRQLSQRELRKQIGLVPQEAYLYSDTVEQNLRYAKPKVTQEEMERACRLAYADEFIKKLPKEYKTRIGNRGVKLSGGQRQRLSLARVILKNPPIVVLDEATSSLDSLSELLIQRALGRVLKNRTAVLIAHRLSTIRRADRIIVIKDRKILEQGTHRQLMEKDGLYASLFKIQAGEVREL